MLIKIQKLEQKTFCVRNSRHIIKIFDIQSDFKIEILNPILSSIRLSAQLHSGLEFAR